MTQEDILEKLFEEVRFRVTNSNTPASFNSIKQTFIESLNDMQYIILPKNVESINDKILDFERIIGNYVSGSGEDFTVNGAPIIQLLASEGWIIIPPI